MKWQKTLLLGIIFLTIVGAFWWFEVKGKQQRERADVEQARLLSGIERIRRFRIETRSGITEVAQDTATKKWQVVAPVFYPADDKEVQGVLKAALEAHYTDVISDSANPAQFGLAPMPWVKFVAEGRTFMLGEETPTRSGVYAQLDGDPRILLVPTEYRQKLLKISVDLRDKSILPVLDAAQLDSVKFIQSDGDEITFVRKGLQWWLSTPVNARADNKLVDATVRGLLGMNAVDFTAEEHSDSAIASLDAVPVGLAQFFPKGGATAEINFIAKFKQGDTIPQFTYAWTPNKKPIFEIPLNRWQDFERSADHFRDRSLEKVTECDSFTIDDGSGFLVSARKMGNLWRVAKPESAKGDKKQIETFLRNIAYTRIDSFKNDEKFAPLGWKFTFYIADDTIVYIVGDTVKNRIQLKKPGESEYYLVSKTNILKWCKPNWKRFVSQRLIDIDASEVVNVSVSIGGEKYLLTKGEPKWKVKTPAGRGKFPFYKVRSAIDAILRVSYKSVLSDTVRWNERDADMRAEIEDTSGNRYYIATGKLEDGTRIAAVSGKTEYFEINDGTVNTIKRKLDRITEKEK